MDVNALPKPELPPDEARNWEFRDYHGQKVIRLQDGRYIINLMHSGADGDRYDCWASDTNGTKHNIKSTNSVLSAVVACRFYAWAKWYLEVRGPSPQEELIAANVPDGTG